MYRFAIPTLVPALLCFAFGQAPKALAANGAELPGGTLYPRVLRVSHGAPDTLGHILASTTGHIFESTDEGRSFQAIAAVTPKPDSEERCCATLYELPQKVGSLAAGTLLYSASFFENSIPSIEVYASRDGGRHWQFHSTVVRRGDAKHGLWEPHFLVTGDGALAVFWSDETDPCCSQKLVQMRTRDGMHWQDETNTVATAVESDRPGMVVATPLEPGSYLMTYEVCGAMHCAVFARGSSDGWHWGEPRDMGRLLRTAQGEYLEHAPTNLWLPPNTPGGPALLVSGQLVVKSDGTVDPLRTGRALFASNKPLGWDAWSLADSPLDVARSFDNYCPNYSSVLLPVASGQSLLELASDYDGTGHCRTYFGVQPLGMVLGSSLFSLPRQ